MAPALHPPGTARRFARRPPAALRAARPPLCEFGATCRRAARLHQIRIGWAVRGSACK